MDKRTLKGLAEVCRLLAEATKDNKKIGEPSVIKTRCHACGRKRTIRMKYKKYVDYSKIFMDRAKVFEELARREK